MSRTLRSLFVVTDLAFIVYWSATALKLIPPEYAYSDYTNPILVAWNWSFFPLDMLISLTGFVSLYLYRSGEATWRAWVLVSLTLTSCSGLQAVAYWAFAGDFDPWWWTANLYLLIYPLFFIPRLLRLESVRAQISQMQ